MAELMRYKNDESVGTDEVAQESPENAVPEEPTQA